MVNCPPAMQETQVRSLGQEDPLEKETAIHSSTLAWKIPWVEEPGRLQSMGLQRVGTWLIDFTCFALLCVSGISLSWSWYTILLMCCWIRVASILLRTFHLCSSVILASNFLSLWYFFLVFISWWWWHHRISLRVFLPLQFLGRVVSVG